MNKQSILQIMDSLLNVDNYHEYLPVIFDKYILDGQNPADLQNFNDQFSYTFNSNPFLWSEIFEDNTIMKIDELGVPTTKYKNVFNLIMKMKALYGTKYMKLQLQTRDPFMLMTTNINIKGNDTTHVITFIRGDQNSMSFNFNAESLLISMRVMQQSLSDSLNSGLFILSEDSVKEYLKINDQLNYTLNQISKTDDSHSDTSTQEFN